MGEGASGGWGEGQEGGSRRRGESGKSSSLISRDFQQQILLSCPELHPACLKALEWLHLPCPWLVVTWNPEFILSGMAGPLVM